MIKHRLIVCLLTVLVLFQGLVFPRAQGNDLELQKNCATPLQYRVLQIVLRRSVLDSAYALVDIAQAAGYNAILVTLVGGVRFENALWGRADKDWSKSDFQSWVAYAQSRGLEVIPGLKLLTHQGVFTRRRYPELMFNAVTYDPRKDEVYQQVVFPLLDEIINAIHPKAFHVGHDEVKAGRKHLRRGEVPLPSDLFLMDVLRIHAHLKSKGVSTWMWGDMLVSPADCHDMEAKSCHGGMLGYGKSIRDNLPRDIVIVDWHYDNEGQEFSSLSVIQEEGFRVIGATWRNMSAARNFANYALAIMHMACWQQLGATLKGACGMRLGN